MSGSFVCPAWGHDLLPVACRHRALDWLRSKGQRRQLCAGAACPHYRKEWEAKVSQEEAERPKCGCGEPLEPGKKRCDDCQAWEHKRIGKKAARRLKAKKAANRRVEESLKGGEMPQETALESPKYPGRPIPEGYTVSAKGFVYRKGTQWVPCHCPTGWKTVKSAQCKACTPPKTAEDLARMRQAKAAKKAVGPKPAPRPAENRRPSEQVKEPVGNELKQLTIHVFGGFSVKDDELNDTQRAIWDECEALAEMLMAKNRAYGNSALEPVRIFSKADAEEQIRVRLDDKLSRLMRGEAAGEDVEQDLMGYLVLLRVQRRLAKGEAA